MNEMDEFEFFLEKPWSDGLPVVTPTEERIERMLAGTSRAPDEVVTPVPPLDEVATVRSVATHAVMAGCKPEYLPVVIAALELIVEEPLNLRGVQATMHSVAPASYPERPLCEEDRRHGGPGLLRPRLSGERHHRPRGEAPFAQPGGRRRARGVHEHLQPAVALHVLHRRE